MKSDYLKTKFYLLKHSKSLKEKSKKLTKEGNCIKGIQFITHFRPDLKVFQMLRSKQNSLKDDFALKHESKKKLPIDSKNNLKNINQIKLKQLLEQKSSIGPWINEVEK